MTDKKDPSKSPRDTSGPVVKTGPTAGENRSRNDDGSWRKKRSDAGSSKKKSGCFISTAACRQRGLPDDCEELVRLRWFRDSYLMRTAEGRLLVEQYYAKAPAIAAELSAEQMEYVWRVITECLRAIDAGDAQGAIIRYMRMFKRIQRDNARR